MGESKDTTNIKDKFEESNETIKEYIKIAEEIRGSVLLQNN
jgi:hypothetical protein